MRLRVVDASALVSVLTDDGDAGRAVAESLTGADLAGPELLLYETANVLRRLELAGRLSPDVVALAHVDLLDLPVQLWPYGPLGVSAWRLRGSLTVYDAAYVALAGRLDVPLVTLDQRLARAAAELCEVIVPATD